MMSKCMFCDKLKDEERARAEMLRFLDENGCSKREHNPGGAEFHFDGKGRVQIFDQCYTCDLETVKKFLARFI